MKIFAKSAVALGVWAILMEGACRAIFPPAMVIERLSSATHTPPPSAFMSLSVHGYRMSPLTVVHLSEGTRKWNVSTDALGCRQDPASSSASTKLLFIGDSVTAAVDERWEDTYTAQTETLLKLRGYEVQSLNCAVNGLSLSDELARLQETLPQIEPRVVILQLYLNDFQRSIGGAPPPLPRWLLWSRAALALQNAVNLTRLRLTSQPGRIPEETLESWRLPTLKAISESHSGTPADRAALSALVGSSFSEIGAAWSTGAWEVMEPQLRQFTSLCQQKNIPLVLAFFPIQQLVQHPEWENIPAERLRAFARANNIPFIDMTEVFRADPRRFPAEKLYRERDHTHPLPAGHTLAAGAITEELAKILEAKATVAVR